MIIYDHTMNDYTQILILNQCLHGTGNLACLSVITNSQSLAILFHPNRETVTISDTTHEGNGADVWGFWHSEVQLTC